MSRRGSEMRTAIILGIVDGIAAVYLLAWGYRRDGETSRQS
jgi:hypothetical protein